MRGPVFLFGRHNLHFVATPNSYEHINTISVELELASACEPLQKILRGRIHEKNKTTYVL